jgi:hypothetical protein
MNAVVDLQSLRNTQLAERPAPNVTMGFDTAHGFELMQRAAKAFAASTLVPQQFQGNIPNCLIALEMSTRIGASPLLVAQNLYIVHGRPGWSAKFLIATFNQCGRFSAIRYEWQGKKGQKDWGCRAWATEKASGERIQSAWITWELVDAEGWNKKSGSKWQTMPEQMFMYRAAAWLVNTHAPEISMGLNTADEMTDVYDAEKDVSGEYRVTTESLRDAEPVIESEPVDPYAKERAEIAAMNSQHDLIAWMNAADKKTKAALKSDLEAARDRIKASEAQPLTFAQVSDALHHAGDTETLDTKADLIRQVADEGQRTELNTLYHSLREGMLAE